MTPLDLPALDGRQPLGLLAALGILRLLSEYSSQATALSFHPDAAHARLHGWSHLAPVIEALELILDHGNGTAPELPEQFPPSGPAPGKLRQPPPDIAQLVKGWDGTEHSLAVRRWTRALVTDLAVDNQGRAALTPYSAPSGQQTLRTMLTKSRDDARARPHALREALTAWRRVPGCTGQYLDHAVLQGAGDHPSGERGAERGVPGATWLAVMALPLLPTTVGSSDRSVADGWQAGGGLTMRWPLWSRPCDLHATHALLTHPGLNIDRAGNPDPRHSRQLRHLGVVAIATARRVGVPGRKSAGVLTPTGVVPV